MLGCSVFAGLDKKVSFNVAEVPDLISHATSPVLASFSRFISSFASKHDCVLSNVIPTHFMWSGYNSVINVHSKTLIGRINF